MSSEAERALRERQALLTSLTRTPAWAELRAVFEARKERDLRVLAANIMADGKLDPLMIAERRGFWRGCQWLLNNPEQAETSLKKAFADAAAATEQEDHE